ncbi:MAG: hypothetical protein ACJ71R_20175 [Nitrososphaeraceae archaeon]
MDYREPSKFEFRKMLRIAWSDHLLRIRQKMLSTLAFYHGKKRIVDRRFQSNNDDPLK